MMLHRSLALALAALLSALAAADTRAAVTLPSIIGDSMVLQRDREVPIWGWDDPGTAVKVKLGDKELSAKADGEGRWLVKFPAMKAGGPLTMTITGTDTKTVK